MPLSRVGGNPKGVRKSCCRSEVSARASRVGSFSNSRVLCTGPSTMSIWAGIPHQPLWQCSSRHLAHAIGTSSRAVPAQPAASFLCNSVLAVPQQPPQNAEGQDPA